MRKPIEKDEDDLDAKNDKKEAIQEQLDDEEGMKSGVIVSKATHQPAIHNLLSNHYVSLQ